MLIDKYIENALYLYQCVIVPGFGGFLAIESPSENDIDKGKSTPSGKKFSFNPTLRVNDGVLASYIANMRDISYAEALLEISHAVDFYLSRLAKGDSVDIAGVGMIKPNEDTSWSFVPYGEKSFSRESYGLESSTPTHQDTANNAEEEKAEKEQIEEKVIQEEQEIAQEEQEIQEEVTNENPAIEEEIKDSQETQKVHSGRTGRIIWVSLVCVFAVICVLFYSFWGRVNTFFEEEEKKNENTPTVNITHVVEVDTIAKADTLKIDTTSIKPIITDLDSLPLPEKVFYVVATSLSSKENAEKEMEKLRNEGFPAVFAGKQYGLYMIAYGGYNDRKEATDVLDSIVKNKNEEAWIKVYDRNKTK